MSDEDRVASPEGIEKRQERRRMLLAGAVTVLVVGAIVAATLLERSSRDEPGATPDPQVLSDIAEMEDCRQLQGEFTQLREGVGAVDAHTPDWQVLSYYLDAIDARMGILECQPPY